MDIEGLRVEDNGELPMYLAHRTVTIPYTAWNVLVQ